MVWETDDSQGRAIALKTLKWSPLKTKSVATEKFKNEFAIFKTLAHPNIAKIFDFGYDPSHDVYYFTSELLTAGDLRSYVLEPIEKVESLLLQALRSLEYLRNRGLLHLDIKPQNFLLRETDDSEQLVLIDFGLATFRPPDKPGGTANYMPPEIVAKRLVDKALDIRFPEPDHRSDLYSLGVTFYYILTGVHPFAVKNDETGRLDINATLTRHLELKEPPPPSAHRSDIPLYLDSIILKLMAYQPDDRYPAAAVASQALRYRSPRELEPEDMESLLSYLPKQGRLIGRAKEIELAERALKDIAEKKPHARPILCIVGGRGTGRTRILESIKPIAQQLEMDTHLINAQQADVDELTNISTYDAISPRSVALLIDDVDDLLVDDKSPYETQAFINPLRELVHRARRTMRLTHPSTAPMFIALSFNTDQVSIPKVFEALDVDDEIAITLKLENFSTEEISEYLASLIGETASAEAARSLHQITEGNPLIMTEQLERMISEGMLFSYAGRPDASTLEAIGLDFERLPPPQSLTEATLEKLHKLNPKTRALAELIACWGEAVDLQELHSMAEPDNVEINLIELISADLVHRIQNADVRYAYNNPMAANVIESNMDKQVREKYHSQIALHLERHHPNRKDAIDHHHARGSRKSPKLRALERLANEAEEHRRPHETTEHLEALLKEIPTNAWDTRADALIRLGRAYDWAYMPRHAEDAFRRLMSLRAPKEKQKYFNVRALEQLALSAIRRRELDVARAHIIEALKALGGQHQDLAWQLRLENFLAGIDLRDGRADAAVEYFERTSELARKLPRVQQKSLNNNELGEALLQAGRAKEAYEILTDELKAAEGSGNHDRICSRHYLLGNVLGSPKYARYDDAMDHYRKALDIAKQRRLLRMQIRIYNSMGNLKLDQGKLDEAIERYRKGLALSEQIDSKTTSVELMVGLGLAYARTEDIDTSIEYFEASLDFVSGPMGISAGIIKRFEPTIYVHLGDAYYRKKNYNRAMAYLKEAQRIDERQRLSDEIRYSIYGTFAEIYVERGEMDKARQYIPRLTEIVQRFTPAKEHLAKLEKRLH